MSNPRHTISTDGRGGIVYRVPGKRRGRARYYQGPAEPSTSSPVDGQAQPARRLGSSRARQAVSRQAGKVEEGHDDRPDTEWPMDLLLHPGT